MKVWARRSSGRCCGRTRQQLVFPASRLMTSDEPVLSCRAAGGELEQIQLLLGHASVQTTERYLGTRQDLVDTTNDGIKLRVVTVNGASQQ